MTEPIRCHALSNGLVLLGEPNASLQSAAFSFLVPAGCACEPPGRGGLSGFAQEMGQRGAGGRDSRQFVIDLDNLGVERNESVSGAHAGLSAATLWDNLPAALEIYADVLRRPRLPADQIEAARQVMLQELHAVEDEPAQKAMIELRRRHYPEPWGRPSTGQAEAVESIDLDEIRRFVAAKYRPGGTILGVAGRFDWDALVRLVERLFGDWTPREAEPIVEAAADGRYGHVEYASGQTQIGIAWPSVPYRHPDYFRAWGAVGVLSGGMSSRLFTEVRERRGLCYSVHASYHTLRDRGAVFCYAGTTAARAQETLDVTLGELGRLAKGIEPAELDRLKARMKSSLVMQQESSYARSASIARDWYHLGRARTLDEVARLVDELTCESINAYLAEHPPADFTIVTLGPRPLEVPGGVPSPHVG